MSARQEEKSTSENKQQQAATLADFDLPSSSSSSSTCSISNSVSLIKLDELSSFGATKQSRLPALIKLTNVDLNKLEQTRAPNSMPDFSETQAEQTQAKGAQQQQAASLPVQPTQAAVADKENVSLGGNARDDATLQKAAPQDDDFQVVEMEHSSEAMQHDEDCDEASVGGGAPLVGPSLPQVAGESAAARLEKSLQALQSLAATGSQQQQQSHLGDSLIDMIISLRNENQSLVRALEQNNDYVKERLAEFKRSQEEAKRRESQFALEKAELEHQSRKLQRQNSVLSERLKSLEAKLRNMEVEVGESLEAARSSKASSVAGAAAEAERSQLYPTLGDAANESFSNSALLNNRNETTMQVDAASGELFNEGDLREASSLAAAQMDAADELRDGQDAAAKLGKMSKEELNKHFDAKKAEFYSLSNDPMKQCDKLEQQLNEIGKRDYEICLLQQQLNIYRQDFRLERMATLEAKIQIERLKNDIDRLCLERVQSQRQQDEAADAVAAAHLNARGGGSSAFIGRLGHQLGRKAAKSAVKAAKYAAKQAHLEEKAAAAMARAASYRAGGSATTSVPAAQTGAPTQVSAPSGGVGFEQAQGGYSAHQQHHHRDRHHHRGHHHRTGSGRASGVRSEVVSDLLSTANKAMLTGYKMASTHVNLALDKLSQFEQQQAANLDKNKQTATPAASAPPMEPPSID